MKARKKADSIATFFFYSSAIFIGILALIILAVLVVKSLPILSNNNFFELLFSSSWRPSRGEFGFLPFIVGTIEVTLIAMAIAIPICLLSSIYLSEYATKRMRSIFMPVIDLLAGIPSVVFGLFGILVIVPFVSFLGKMFGSSTTGYSLLSGSIILAIMVFPIIISVATAVLRSVPHELRESSLALGATRWQTVKKVVVRSSIGGLIAAVVLGFSRAIGETMAVLMVIGNVAIIPKSLFDPAYTLTSLIANNYGEMMSIPMYDSALLLAALMLLLIVAFFNIISHIILSKLIKHNYTNEA